MSEMEQWLATRPECVQKLAKEFPLGTQVNLEGEILQIIGYTEDDMLIISPYDPYEDYEAAVKHKKYICADHLRGPSHGH